MSIPEDDNLDDWAEANAPVPPQATSDMAGPTACSASIARLSAALAKAQGQIEGAEKAGLNPHFKAGYPTLASVWDACRAPLAVNELAVLQLPSTDGSAVTVATILAHSSGEWVRSELTMTAQTATPQAIGSCITYGRRYALMAMVGVAPEDDDGNAASHGEQESARLDVPSRPAPFPTRAPAKYEEQWTDLQAVADEGTVAFNKAWELMSGPFKNFTIAYRKDELTKVRQRAAASTKGGKP